MDQFKLCSDGEFMPVSHPCPPPYSGPSYYYPYENIPLPPADQGDTTSSPNIKEGAPISSGAVASVIIILSSLFFIMCFIGLKFRRRFILGRVSSRNSRHAGEPQYVNSGDHMLVNMAGCGLEEKLVNLLPVCEYVGLMQEGKVDGKERHECSVCLSLFEEKEIVRVLPKCKHTFHVQCIDKWFESHSNCPLCRERITLQTIQLSFNADSHNDQQPLGPVVHEDLTLSNQNSADFSHLHLHDQHVNFPPLCVHNVHDQQDGRSLQDLNPHQNIFLAAASATNINNTPTSEPFQYQHADHPVSHAAVGHLVNDQNAAGFICRLQGLSDQNTLSIPVVTAESMKNKHDAESREDENASNEAAKDAYAHYIDDDQFGAPACGLESRYDHPNPLALNDQSQCHAADDRVARSQIECNKTGDFLNPKSSQQAHEVDIDDHKKAHEVDSDDQKSALTSLLAEKFLFPSHGVDPTLHKSQNILLMSMISSPHPITRAFKVLRKSLSTGSINIGGDAKASHPF